MIFFLAFLSPVIAVHPAILFSLSLGDRRSPKPDTDEVEDADGPIGMRYITR